MGHEITATDRMFYSGRKPWHNAGEAVTDVLVSAHASLSWTVSKRPVMAVIDGETAVAIPDRFAVVRDDTLEALEVVSGTYKTIQNERIFAVHDALASEGIVIPETVGSVRGGRRVWAASKLSQSFVTRADGSLDELTQYLVFFNSHNKTGGGVILTLVRVVCDNTLNFAIEGATRRGTNPNYVPVWHRGDTDSKIKEAHRVLLESKAGFEKSTAICQALEGERMSMQAFRSFAEKIADAVGSDPTEKSSKAKVERARQDRLREIEQLTYLFGEGKGNSGATKWDAYNALCEWLDHERKRYRQAKDARVRAENHMASTVWGQSVNHKGAALKLLAKA